jgi:hypothetical protein
MIARYIHTFQSIDDLSMINAGFSDNTQPDIQLWAAHYKHRGSSCLGRADCHYRTFHVW